MKVRKDGYLEALEWAEYVLQWGRTREGAEGVFNSEQVDGLNYPASVGPHP